MFPVSSLAADDSIDYMRDIKPVLKQRCYACHGVLKSESSLRLDTANLTQQGGDNGPAIIPGNPIDSLLIARITAEDAATRMPPEGEPLTADQIARLTTWIEQGAIAPENEQPEEDPRNHWAFRVPICPPLPEISDSAWSLNPIDRFIAQEHKAHGLTPQPLADRSLLLRRVSLDLIGLPPTADELRAFLADDSPDAYERMVDRLLESPQYGERWARHWMDVWRYADWFGRRMVPDVWNSAPQIWRWRDWIVTSLNEDKSYARMIQEMLAADEIAPEDPEAAVATGYLIRNWYALNPNDWMRSTVEHTSKAFLGLTYNCAHCHDHKYDPISQEDYFRMRAFFEPIGIRQDRVPGEADPGPFQEYEYSTLRKINRLGAVSIYDKSPDAVTWFYRAGDERNRDEERGNISPGLPMFFGHEDFAIETVALPAISYYPAARPDIQQTILSEHRNTVTDCEQKLTEAQQAAEQSLPELRESLTHAQRAFDAAIETALAEDSSGAISGEKSLLLDARTGRRLLNHDCHELSSLEDGLTLRFDVQIVQDAHFNMQLAKDAVKGLTAAYVGFVSGQIIAYQPGAFTEFEVGRYDHVGGQQRLTIELVLDPDQNQCLLTVRCVSDNSLLVDATPVALNAWNPVGDPTKALSFDAHEGTVVLIDDVEFVHRNATQEGSASPVSVTKFDFEGPEYHIGEDLVGMDGWSASSFSSAPARSLITPLADVKALDEVMGQLMLARRAVERYELGVKSAELSLTAAQASLSSIEARLAAGQAKFIDASHPDLDELSQIAIKAERDAELARIEADMAEQEHLLAVAEAKPTDAEKRQEAIDTASQKLVTARTALTQVREAKPQTDFSPVGPVYNRQSTGRRKALSEWIGSYNNPLTARVAVNHIWMRHFHTPLVSTVYDFGRNGAPPTHPELLDWLADEFMDSGWSMKHLHRLIVNSRTYRLASSQGDVITNTKRDPENRYLWRMNVGRMQAEAVRDSLLFCANQLDLRLGGQELENKDALTTNRRSLYYSCQPEADGKSQFGALFDAPDANDCYRRTRSIVPQQALALTNAELIHDLSILLAEKLSAECETSFEDGDVSGGRAFVGAAYQQILSRSPSEQELEMCVDFLDKQQAVIASETPDDAERRAEASLVRVLFSHNDFIGIR
ncbi:MAG: DUF1553 domain-containing protein [Planctomycetaceae bacterium]|nr:DUF1553 domain-containing protein [Planctomycetaceae bacterium]